MHEFEDERGGETASYKAWRPLDQNVRALLDYIEEEGITVLADEQLSELQEQFRVSEQPRDAGAGTLRFNLVGFDAEIRRLLLERGFMFYACGHWHKDSAADLDAPPSSRLPCADVPRAERVEGGEARRTSTARYARRDEHPH
jgi:hypothetical protein